MIHPTLGEKSPGRVLRTQASPEAGAGQWNQHISLYIADTYIYILYIQHIYIICI